MACFWPLQIFYNWMQVTKIVQCPPWAILLWVFFTDVLDVSAYIGSRMGRLLRILIWER